MKWGEKRGSPGEKRGGPPLFDALARSLMHI